MAKKNDEQETLKEVLEESFNAIDEFCLKTELLERIDEKHRGPGTKIIRELKDYNATENSVLYQIKALERIRENGKPLESMEFGRYLNNELNLPAGYKGIIHSYPSLYYKEGGGRRNDFYKPLDNSYCTEKSPPLSIIEKRMIEIKQKINYITEDKETFDRETQANEKARIEQALLREYLLLRSAKDLNEDFEGVIGQCQICKKTYPKQILIAAHIKPRSKCSHTERSDIENIAILQCALCDALYESGIITIGSNGLVLVRKEPPTTEDLEKALASLEGIDSLYINGNEARAKYSEYHRVHIFGGIPLEND